MGGRSGCSPLGVLPPRFPPCCLLPLWVVSAAAWELASHFFSLTFSFGVVVAPWFLVGVLQRFSPPGGFLLQFLEGVLPPLWRWRDWMAESSRPIRSLGRLPGACSKLSSSPLALHGVVSASPVCLSRTPAFRQVRVAMLAEGSVESPSVLVLAFHSSLFLVEGSSDGSAPGDRSSPLDGCVYSLRFRLRSVASALSLLGSWAFLPLCLSVYCRTWWHLSSRKLFGVPVGFTSSSPLHGGVLFDLFPILSWVFSPGFGRGSPSLGWDYTGLVACLLLAPRG